MSNKQPSIPTWQRANSLPGLEEPDAAPTPSAQQDGAEDATKTQSSWGEDHQQLMEQARKWLQEPSIKYASREKKVAFLESKGLRSADISALLEACGDEDKTIHDSTQASTPEQPSQPPSSSTSQPSQSSAPTPSPQSASPPAVPPVITYPEFLLHSTKPPPLVTTTLLLNTAYLASGLAASMYGLSRYLVQPMQSQLSAARHDFFTHTASKLSLLNERLESAVSSIPASARSGPSAAPREDDDSRSDTTSSSAADDPSELFHRDIGVQTSPSLSAAPRRPSSASSSQSISSAASSSGGAVAAHASHLQALASRLADLRASSAAALDKESDVAAQLAELRGYLADIRYSSPYYGWKGGAGWMAAAADRKDEDELERVRAEIRGVKGVLLSTRNFPRGAGGGGGGAGKGLS